MNASILTEAFYQRLQVPFLHKNVYVNFVGKKKGTYISRKIQKIKWKKSEENPSCKVRNRKRRENCWRRG